MGYVIALIVVVAVVIVGAVLVRLSKSKRAVSYAPDPNLRPGTGGGQYGSRIGPGAIPQVAVPTPEFETEVIVHREFTSDVADDLLDPRNPHHAEWVKEHPEMETNEEWLKEHPEDNAP